MAARKGLVLSLGFDARGAFDKMVASFKKEVQKMEQLANKTDLGKSFTQKFQGLKDELEAASKRTEEIYKQMQEGKVSSEAFDDFTKKIEADFKNIRSQIDGLQDSFRTLGGSKVASEITEQFRSVKAEFLNLKQAVEQVNTAFGEVIKLSDKYGQNMETSAKTLVKSLKTIQKSLDQANTAPRRGGYGLRYEKYLSPFDDDPYSKQFTSDSAYYKFLDDYNTHKDDLSFLIDEYGVYNKQMVEKEKQNLKGSQEWYLAAAQRMAVTKKIIDAYMEMRQLEAINSTLDVDAIMSSPMQLLGTDTDKKSMISNLKNELKNFKATIGNYIEDVDPQQITASMFELKDGKVRIPVDLDIIHNTSYLSSKIQKAITAMQGIAEANPLKIPIALQGVKVKGQASTVNLLKRWGYDFEDAKDIVSSKVMQMGNIIADKNVDTPNIDLGDQYARAYLNSFKFASQALKFEISKMKQQFLGQDGKPISIPVQFDYEASIEQVRKAIDALRTDEDGKKIPMFENLSIPDAVRNELANAGQTAANSWQNAMLSSVGVVATHFQSALGKGLQLDNTLLQRQLNGLKNQLSMAFAKIPQDQNKKSIQDSLMASARGSFVKEYTKVQKEAARGQLKDEQMGVLDAQLHPRGGFVHYFEQTFQYLQRMKQMGMDVTQVLMDLGNTSWMKPEDLSTIGKLWGIFEAENPIPDNIAGNIQSIVQNFELLKDVLTELSAAIKGFDGIIPKDTTFGIDPAALDGIIGKVQQMINLTKQVNGIPLADQIQAQWTKVQEAYNAISRGTFSIADPTRGLKVSGEAKKQLDNLYQSYKKYREMGGTKTILDDIKQDRTQTTITGYKETANKYIQDMLKGENLVIEDLGTGLEQAGLKSAESWRDAMLSAIGEIKSAIQNMFSIKADNKLFDTLKGWRDADRIMREERKGAKLGEKKNLDTSTVYVKNGRKYQELDYSQQPAVGQLQRAMLYNSRTGKVSNAYTVDQNGSTGLTPAIERLAGSIDQFDTALHSHPLNQGEDSGLKSIGHNLGFSGADMDFYLNHYIHKGIKKLAVESNGMMNELDLSELDAQVRDRINQLYHDALNSTENHEAWEKARDYTAGTFDYDLRDQLGYHKFMKNAIIQAITQDAKTKGQILKPEDIDVSKYYRQFSIEEFNKPFGEDGTVYFNSLTEGVNNLFLAMSKLNGEGGLNFKIDTSSLQNLDSRLQAIISSLQSLKQNFELTFGNLKTLNPQSIDILKPLQKEYAKFVEDGKKDSTIFSRLGVGEDYFGDTFRTIQKYQAVKGDANFDQLFKNITKDMPYLQGGHLQTMYELFNEANPIPLNFAQSLKSAFQQINGITATISGGESGAMFGLSADSISQINGAFSALSSTLKQISQSSSTELAESMSKVSEAINAINQQKLQIDPQAFSDICSHLENMLHLFEQVYNINSQDTLESQWDVVRSKFDQLSGSTQNEKQKIEQLTAAYQKYLDMGGTRSYEELATPKVIPTNIGTTGAQTAPSAKNVALKALAGVTKTEQKPEQRILPGAEFKYTDNLDEMQQRLQTFVERLKQLSSMQIPINFTMPEDGKFAQNLKSIFDSISDSEKLSGFADAIDRIVASLGTLNGLQNVTNVLNGLKFTKTGGENLGSIGTNLKTVVDQLNRLTVQESGANLFSSIENIISKSKDLQNLVTALKASKKDLKDASYATSGKKPEKEKAKANKEASKEAYDSIENIYKEIIAKQKSITKGMSKQEVNAIQKTIADYEKQVGQLKLNLSGNKDIQNTGRNDRLALLQKQIALQKQLAEIRRKAAAEQASQKTSEDASDKRTRILQKAKATMEELSQLGAKRDMEGGLSPTLQTKFDGLFDSLVKLREQAISLKEQFPGIVDEFDKLGSESTSSLQTKVTESMDLIKTNLKGRVNEIKNSLGELAKEDTFSGLFDKIEKSIEGLDSKDKIPQVQKDLKKLAATVSEFQKSNVKTIGWERAINELTTGASDKIPKYTYEIQQLSETLGKYKQLINKRAKTGVLSDMEKADLAAYEKQLNQGIGRLQKNSGGRYNQVNKLGAVTNFQNVEQIENYLRSLSGIDAASMKITSGNDRVSASFRQLNGDVKSVTVAFDAEMGVWRQVTTTTIETANIFDRIGTSIKNSASYFRHYFSGYMVAQKIISSVRNAITTISDLDHQFAEMQKVSQDSYASLREYADGAYDMAQRLGSTTSDILNSTADFLRIGQSIDKAGQSAQTAAILKNVSQYENISDATDSLIAMEQAYQDVDPMSIVDKLNLVGDRFAISTDELADGMKNAGSTLSLLGNSIDDTAALLTSANTVIQDISKVSSGMRTIALRVVGTEEGKAKLEEDGEDTGDYVIETKAKKRAKIKKYTATASNKQGVDILDENGNYKTTYEYMKQIASVYKEIQKQDKKFGTNRAVALIEELAGKNRSNIASAILSNPELLEKVKDVSLDSAGSALREQQIQLESIQGRMATFKAQAEEFWTSFVDTGVVKGFISFGTEVLDVITDLIKKVPSLTTAFSALIGVLATKGNWGLLNYDRNRGFSFPLFQAFKPYVASQGTMQAVEALKGMETSEFNVLRANENGAIPTWVNQFGDADAKIGGFIATANNLDDAINNINNNLINSRPIITGFKSVISGLGNVLGNFVSAFANFGMSLAISMAFREIGKLIDYINVTEQEIIQAGQKAEEVIKSTRKGVQKEAEVLKKVEDSDFDRLMQGVDTDTNKNISLTEDQYKNYLQLCNEIAEVYPEVVASYDAQGNAILSLGDNAGTASEQLKALLDIDKELAGIEIGKNLQDRFMGIKAEAIGKQGNGGIQKKIKEDQTLINEAQAVIDKYASSTYGLQSSNEGLSEDIREQFNNDLEYLDLTAYSTQVQAEVRKLLYDKKVLNTQVNTNPLKASEYGEGKLHYYKGAITSEIIDQVAKYVQEAQPLSSVDQEQLQKQLQKAYAKRSEGEQKKAAHTKELEAKFNQLKPDISAAIQNNPNFELLGEGIQKKLLDTIGNIDLQNLPDDVMSGDTQLLDWLQNQYLYPVSIAFNQSAYDTPEIRKAKEDAQQAFIDILTFDPEKVTGEEYYNLVTNKNQGILQEYFKTVLNDQDGSQFQSFIDSYIKGNLGIANTITEALGLSEEEKGEATEQLQKLTMKQLNQVYDIVSDPKFGGTLRDAIKKATEQAKTESVSLSDILGIKDDDGSIISQSSALKEASQAINTYKESINGGEFTRSDFSKLIEEYPQLAKDTDLLNDVMASFDTSGFLTETDSLNDALNSIQIDKLEDFRKKFAEEYSLIEDESQKQAARNYYQSVVADLIPSNVSQQSVSDYLDKVAAETGLTSMNFVSAQYNILKAALEGEHGADVVMRILADPSLAEMSIEQLVDYIVNTRAEIKLEVNEQEIKSSISSIQQAIQDSNSIKEFETNLSSGTATVEDLLGIIQKYPQALSGAEDSFSDLISTADFSGQIDNLEGMKDIISQLKVINLNDALSQIESKEHTSDEQKELLKRSVFASTDLSGISRENAADLVKTYGDANDELLNLIETGSQLEVEAATYAATVGVGLDQAFQIIEARQEQMKVTAVQNFQSMGEAIDSFSEKVTSGEVTSGDVLGLVETFPELLSETDVLGEAFAGLSLNGAVSDASALQSVLQQIAQMRLQEILGDIKDPAIVQAMANTIDMSNTRREDVWGTIQRLRERYNLDDVDLNTKEGLDIAGHIKFVLDTVGLENMTHEQIQTMIDNAISQGMYNGVKRGVEQVQKLSSDMSSLQNATQAIATGEFGIDDIASLKENFDDLNITGKELDAIYSSINMEGFVQDAESANTLINQLKLSKITEFYKNNPSMTNASKQALLNATRLTGIGDTEGKEAYEKLKNRKDVDQDKINQIYQNRDYNALVRLQLRLLYNGEEDFNAAVEGALEASAEDKKLEFTQNLDILTNLSEKNTGITSFIDQFASGEATVDGLLSLLGEVPEIALYSGEALAQMIDSADFDGTITSIDKLSQAARKFTFKNIEDQFKQIEQLTNNKHLQNALKGYLLDQIDLSGARDRDVNNALKETTLSDDVRKQILQDLRKGEFTAEAVMKVLLKGDIDDSDVMEQIEGEQEKISRKELSASIQAEINLHSDISSLDELQTALLNGEADVDSILNLMNSMPDFLTQVQALGIAVADMDMDELVDNTESFEKAIASTKFTKLMKFMQKDGVTGVQKMSNILNTSLKGISATDRYLNNSNLFDLLKGKNYSADAAFKVDLMIDNGLISDNVGAIQAVLDSLDTDVQIKTEVANLQKTIAGLQTLDTAVSEFNDSGTVSAETVQALSQAGINYNEVLFESESGIKVNTEAANAMHDSMAETGIAMSRMITMKSLNAMRQNRDRMNEIIDSYNEAHEETLSLSDVLSDATTYGEQFAEVFQLNEANSSIAQATNNLQNMEAELRNSIDLFTKFQEAQSSANPSDNYNTVTGAMQEAKKLWDQGWLGKDDFQSFAQLIAPEGTDVQQAVKDFEKNYEHVKGYLTEDTSGLWKFLDDAEAKGFFEDTGDGLDMMIDDLDSFAKEMGISTSLAEQFFFAMKDMNLKVDFSSLTDSYRDQINQLSGNMDQSNAGQQIQNAIDKFFTFSEAGEDVRDSLDPLVAAMNEFKKLHPEQDIQPWIDSLNSLGLLNGFTISVNDDGSLSYTTAELDKTVSLIKEIRGQDPATVEVGVEVSDEQKGQIYRLLQTEEGRQALISVGFEVNENTKFGDIVEQLTDPNHPLQIPVEFKPVDTSTTTSQQLIADTGIAEHEKRKGQLALSGSTQDTAAQPEPIVTEFKLNGVDEAKQQLDDLQTYNGKTIHQKVVVDQQDSGSTTTPATQTATAAAKSYQGQNAEVSVGAKTGELDDAKKKLSELQSMKIGNKSFRVNAINLTAVMNNLTTVNNTHLEDKQFHVLCPGLPTVMSQITTIANKISQLDGKVANASVNVKVNKSGGSVPPVLGTAFTLGSAYASGTARAGGRDFTVGQNETALVNEIGQESRVHNGKWELLPGGPHIQKLDKDDIIFNAQQTQDLIRSGKTARQGKPVAPSAYAKGTARDLVGEEGIEMYVDPHRGKWQTVGEVGPEFIDLPKDAVVFNHDQTTDLLSKGYTNTRATLAHVDGTFGDIDLSDEDFIYNPSDESEYGNAFLTGNVYVDPRAQTVGVRVTDEGTRRTTKKPGSSDNESKNDNTKATEQNTKATKDNTKKKKDEGQVFDWIASRLSYLADQTSKFADAITDFISYSDKMTNLIGKIDQNGKTINATDSYNRSRKGQLASILQEIAETRQGANRYKKEANNVKAPYSTKTKSKTKKAANKKFEETKKMIDAGYVINIETIKDSNLATAISNYQQYADSARQAENNVENLQRSLIELYSTWAKAPAEEAEKQIERLTKGLQGLEAAQARLDALGKGGSTQSILDRLLGRSDGKGIKYRNLGGAGFEAFAQDNANKTNYYKKAWQESKKALLRLQNNYTDYINYESNRLYGQPAIVNVGAVTSPAKGSTTVTTKKTASKKASTKTVSKKTLKSTGKSLVKKYKSKLSKKQQSALKKGKKVSLGNTKGALRTKLKNYNKQVAEYNSYESSSDTGTITKKQVKNAGKAVAKKYAEPLSKKQQTRLKEGKTVTLTKKQKKNKKLKEAVKKQNDLVKARKAQQAVKSSGKAIAKKYAKVLSSQQQKDLKAGKKIALTAKQKKNKKLVAAVKKHNSKVKTATTATEKSAKITAKKQATPASDVVGEYKQGKQIFDDAVAEAQADAVAKAAEYAAQKVQEIRDNFDYLSEAYETQLKYQESVNKLNEQQIEDAETFGDQIKATDRDLQENNLAINKMIKEQEASNLQKILDAGIKNGTIQENSKEWLEMTEQINAAKSAAHDYGVQIKQTEIKKLEDIVNHYSKIVDSMESILELTNAMKGYDFDDAVNNYKKASYYSDNITAKQEIASKKWEEASKEQVEFWQMAGGEGSAYEVGTDSYIQKQTEINKLWKDAYDARADVAKLAAEQIQFQIEQWTRAIDKQDKFIDNLNTIGGLMNDAAKWNFDTGNLTEQGQMSMVIDKESYVNAINDLQAINEERERLQERFETDANYGQQAYDEDLENLVSRQMSALNSAKSALESFTKTVETTAQKQLEALNKVINKYKESLQKKQQYHNYDKQLKNSNKEIALLEAQSRALEGVADAESKAMKARIDAQIQQKREALQDTTREHSVSLQTQGLSDLQEKLQENYERWSQEFEANASKQLAVMQSTNMSTTQLEAEMKRLLDTYGVTMSQLNMTTGKTYTDLDALKGSFNSYTLNDTAYNNAVKSNADLQAREIASWQGPISQALATKLTTEFAKITSEGQQKIVDAIGTTAAKLVDSGGNNLIAQVSARIGTKDSGLTASVQKVAAGISKQAQITQDNTIPTITGKIDEVIDAINGKNASASSGSSAKSSAKSSSTSGSTTTSMEMGVNGYLYKVTRDSKGKVISATPTSPNVGKFVPLKGKARGSLSINKDSRYLTQEKGGEIITTKDGVLIPLKAGDGVIPAQLTDKLFEMARDYPNLQMSNVEIPTVPTSGTNQNVTVSYGSLLTVNGNITEDLLPDLKTILRESYKYTEQHLAMDARKAGMRKKY